MGVTVGGVVVVTATGGFWHPERRLTPRAPGTGGSGRPPVGEDDPVLEILITTGSIRLGQLLKLAGIVEQGSDARILLAGGEVLVNGEPETRRGRQIRPGDVVTVDGGSVRVV